ncbi:RagB/SusD family nutrient uptake outer membrane protein [uncultured Alistipes sp.]|uniref:RagB/SusD family nutrient uptake outer membrane protein n=1 Tax=uncultured Alistipes sp. TaxID=538949 RepID=UPI0025E82686|nr:RagB/SusD family nutrient uptake outer membrane protein [uncultured Alistipes sp.]
MKKKIINIVLLGATIAMTGCNDWLDMDPTNKVSEKIVWSDVTYVTQYVNGFYPYISRYGVFETGDSQVGLTEGLTETLKFGSSTPGTNVGFANIIAFAQGGLSAPTASFHFGAWDDTYTRIRRVNEFLYNLKKYGGGFGTDTYNRFEAEARFFRGYLYYQLLKRTPQVILYDEDLLAITKNKALATADEGWDMVEADLSFAGKTLPSKWPNESGRVTSGAAYAMLSRAMLYAERWQSAKDAAEEVFKLGYVLMPGATAAEYAKAFTSMSDGNTESILEYNYLLGGPNHSWDKLFMPGGDNVTMGGRAAPTQEMVESYELATTGGYPDWSPWHTTTGTTDTPPYAQLEPRFHASVFYNGCEWKGRTLEPYINGKDGWAVYDDGSSLDGRTTTGYYLRKMMDEDYTDYSTSSTQPWIAIRLAEVLLNHAEACYMLGVDGANADLKKIRERVGLPYSNKSGADLLAAIRQERKVELYCEGHLYWDMRRWKLAHTAYTGMRVHGLKIEKQGADFIYTYVDCDRQDRLFQEKLYRIPLPETELSNNNAVRQFSEWL